MIRHRIVSDNGDDAAIGGGLQEIKQEDAEDDINVESGYFKKKSIV